jgi:hypothetical protein
MRRRLRAVLSDDQAHALVTHAVAREFVSLAKATCAHGHPNSGPCVFCGRLTRDPDPGADDGA